MNSFLVKAEAEGFIWLIVGVFWVIAQIAGAAKKKPPQRPASDDAEERFEDPFGDLMRKLGGAQEFKIPTPPEPKEIKTERPWEPGDIEALPDVQPVRRAKPLPKPKPLPTPEPIEVPNVDIRSFKSAMPSMKFPAMKLSFQGSEKSGYGVSKAGKIINSSDKQTLRRAVLGHMILGKPKALEGWSSGTVE